MRIQAYFYLWKKTTSEVSLKALNETLIQVGHGDWSRRIRVESSGGATIWAGIEAMEMLIVNV